MRIGQNVKEVLEADLAGEYDARTAYKASRDICYQAGDYVSMKLFEELLMDEEGHIDFLETQLGLMDRIGEENYALLTRGLGWEPSYEKKEDIFRYISFEGVKIHDWDKWEDPFRLTMDAYWKYQGEKERKLYAIVDAFQQHNGQFNVTDARYVQALKLFKSQLPAQCCAGLADI